MIKEYNKWLCMVLNHTLASNKSTISLSLHQVLT